MKKSLKIVKLDFLVIFPYLTVKNLCILLAFLAFYGYVLKNPMIGLVLPIIFSSQYSSFPFLAGEDTGIDILYRSFGIEGKEVVRGRFIWTFLICLLSQAIGLFFYFILSVLAEKPPVFEEMIPQCISFFLFTIFFSLIQLPVLFRLGFKKAKPYIVFLFLAVAALIFMLSKRAPLFLEILKKAETLYMAGGITIFLLLLVTATYKVSVAFYKNKDF